MIDHDVPAWKQGRDVKLLGLSHTSKKEYRDTNFNFLIFYFCNLLFKKFFLLVIKNNNSNIICIMKYC